jgi:hypothetical protein
MSEYAYDANGNTLSDPSGKSYSWDFENRLTQAVVPGTNDGTTTCPSPFRFGALPCVPKIVIVERGNIEGTISRAPHGSPLICAPSDSSQVLEITFAATFDSFRAHHLFNKLPNLTCRFTCR